MIDINFQTAAANEVHNEAIDLARSILRTAQSVLIDAMLNAYPVGAKVRLRVGPRKWAYCTVAKQKEWPSKWVSLKYDNTGGTRVVDITTASIELVTYAYEVREKVSPEDYMLASSDFVIGEPVGYKIGHLATPASHGFNTEAL
jgi:hypothetical protein